MTQNTTPFAHLTDTQHAVLAFLLNATGASTANEVATEVGKSASTVRRAFKSLTTEGLVQHRDNDPKGAFCPTGFAVDANSKANTAAKERATAALKAHGGNMERAAGQLAANGDRRGVEQLQAASEATPEPTPEPEATPSPAQTAPVAETATEAHPNEVPKAERAAAALAFLKAQGTRGVRASEVADHLCLAGTYRAQAAVAALTSCVKAGTARKITIEVPKRGGTKNVAAYQAV